MTKVPVTARTRKQLLQRDLRRNDDVHNFGSASTVAKVGPPQILLNWNQYHYTYKQMRVVKEGLGLIQEWV